MPLPRAVARFNRRATNRVLGPLAPYLPTFGVVEHRGRKSGRLYRTPINIFPRPGGCTIVLTYGPQSDWVQNVLAAGGCHVETGGRRLRLVNPRVVHDETRRLAPRFARPIGRLAGIADFLLLDSDPAPPRR
jgi:deazaflavin-dependent oxidoreductase (nitroreductase family)